jgi:hypothetical protein
MSEHFVLCERHDKNQCGNLVVFQIQDMMSQHFGYYFHNFRIFICLNINASLQMLQTLERFCCLLYLSGQNNQRDMPEA